MDGLLVKEEVSFSNLTLIAIEAALLAGNLLRQGFGTHFSIKKKSGIHNLVTEYDLRSERAIIDFISNNVPNSHFLAEESGSSDQKAKGLIWIIDPLDGTVNFAHGIPMFSVSIAAELDGEVVSGVVFHPIVHELFVAEKGKGAFLYRNNLKNLDFSEEGLQNSHSERRTLAKRQGPSENANSEANPARPKSDSLSCFGMHGQKLKVSPVFELQKSILATGFPYNLIENPGQCIDHFVDLLKFGIPIRRLGAATLDLAYTAAGRFEGFFEVSLGPWDCAAGKLLVEEAGGQVTDWKGNSFDFRSYQPIMATNGSIHQATSAILSRKI